MARTTERSNDGAMQSTHPITALQALLPAPLRASLHQHGMLHSAGPSAGAEADGKGGAAAGGALRGKEEEETLPLLKVVLLSVGSGRYSAFSSGNTRSAERYLLRGVAQLHYFIFTDDVAAVEGQYRGQLVWEQGRVHVLYRPHDGYVCVCVRVCVCVYVCVHFRACFVCVCVDGCMHACIHTMQPYIHTYIHT